MTRRTFSFALAALPARPAVYAPKIAVQCYVWTQDLAARGISLADGLPQLFSETASAGYKRIELMASFFTAATRPRTEALLKEHGFQLPIVYSGARLYDNAATVSAARVVELAAIVKPLGCRIINVNPDPKPDQAAKSEAELNIQARNVEILRGQLRDQGVRLILHHHSPEMKDAAREWHHLLHNTEAGLCIDVDWVFQGGQDPLALLKAAGDRLASLHLRNASGGIWTQSLAEGDYDYQPLREHLKQIGFDGYLVVELAWNPKTVKTRTLRENLQHSRQWAEETFLK
jgi:inosose dehydratase